MSDQQSGESDAVRTERWGTLFTAGMVVALAFPLVVAPVTLFLIGERLTAGLVATSAWFMLCFYESPLEEQLKQEVLRRV